MEITKTFVEKLNKLLDAGLISGLGSPEPGKMCGEAAICFALGEPHGDSPTCVGAQDRSFYIKLNDARWSSDKARANGMRRLSIAQLGSIDLAKNQQKQWLDCVVLETIRQIVPPALRAVAKSQPDKHKQKLEDAAKSCENATDLASGRAAAAAAAAAATAATATATAAAAATAAAYAAYAAAYAADAAADAAAARAADAAAARAADAAAANAADAAADAAANAADAAAYAADEILAKSAEIAVQAYVSVGAPGVAFLGLEA